MIVNSLGRRPLCPWSDQQHNGYNLILGVLSLIGTITPASLTISRCDNSDKSDMDFIAIGLLLLSIGSNVSSILGAGEWICGGEANLYHHSMRGRRFTFFFTGCFLLAAASCTLMGTLGVATSIWHAVPTIQKVTLGVFIPMPFIIYTYIHLTWTNCTGKDRGCGLCYSAMLKFGLMSSFAALIYMDWSVATVAKNWSGLPYVLDKTGKILYWVYFVSKRLTLCTF
jgi:hypothetical protein